MMNDSTDLLNTAAVRRLLMVYHSTTGATQQMVQAAMVGAAEETEVIATLRHADDVQPAEMLASDGYLFATPENLAAMSGRMKDFFDRCYYPLQDHIQGRPYAIIVCAGSDGQGAVRQIERIVTGWRLTAIAPALVVCTGAQTMAQILAPKTVAACELRRGEELGAAFAAGLACGIF